MKNNRTEAMFSLVERWRQSGQSKKAFCRDHDLKAPTFSYWVGRKNKANHQGEGFLPVDVSDYQAGQVELIYPNGVKLRLPGGDARLITALIKSF
ncbi:MAG: hypothetical protein WD098_08855 [Balneolales bacterium]